MLFFLQTIANQAYKIFISIRKLRNFCFYKLITDTNQLIRVSNYLIYVRD